MLRISPESGVVDPAEEAKKGGFPRSVRSDDADVGSVRKTQGDVSEDIVTPPSGPGTDFVKFRISIMANEWFRR